jgi:hypothetical protein
VQEVRTSDEDLFRLRPALRLAEEMGAVLGRGQDLFRPVPADAEAQAF